ncbi:Deoxycytidylate deaminase [Merluccius polli]|uniref:dCMP deaminase n=1 Tax=Merluccius polli TaxID=89951 RepID=A0AA47NYE4_MERPO|nr:Deoxycytidylate deaminase [Merluccius polli]
MNKNSADVKGCTIYVALFPCNECAKLIIQAGIKDVVFLSDKYHDSPMMTASRRLLSIAGIEYRDFKPKRKQITVDFDSLNPKKMKDNLEMTRVEEEEEEEEEEEGGGGGGGGGGKTKVDQQRRHDEAPERNVAAFLLYVHGPGFDQR